MGEPKYTVYIRVPIPRGDFVDPPPVDWDAAKDEALWQILSGATQKEIDWNDIANRFDVTVDFLLQQVAYLTERHASQVRAQVRKATAAAKGSAAPSPVPTSDALPTPQQRAASGLSISRSASRDSTLPRGDGTPTLRPAASRNPSENTTVLRDGSSSSPRPDNKPVSLKTTLESTTRRRLSSLPITSSPAKSPERLPESTKEEPLSPGPADSSSGESSDEESVPAQSRIIRRPPRFQQQQQQVQETDPSYNADDDDDDESEPAFQRYTDQTSASDLASTVTGDNKGVAKRSTKQSNKEAVHHSQTSDSSAGSPALARGSNNRQEQANAGVSPLRRTDHPARSPQGKVKVASQDGSDGTPSMGSSFSDLEDASVTQSALEEALASHMRGAGSRFSISQAFRSRYTPGSNN
ncbi:hypothetical protein K4F52_009734 [Lecanicillium sp. MT-2017a]|nr:hypothetical protein K4F52_009734 [Lecanicillium sp. MT-2017a]